MPVTFQLTEKYAAGASKLTRVSGTPGSGRAKGQRARGLSKISDFGFRISENWMWWRASLPCSP